LKENRAQYELRDLWGYTVVLRKNRNSTGGVWYEKIMGNGDGGNTLKDKREVRSFFKKAPIFLVITPSSYLESCSKIWSHGF